MVKQETKEVMRFVGVWTAMIVGAWILIIGTFVAFVQLIEWIW